MADFVPGLEGALGLGGVDDRFGDHEGHRARGLTP